jgi:hypothetical protein
VALCASNGLVAGLSASTMYCTSASICGGFGGGGGVGGGGVGGGSLLLFEFCKDMDVYLMHRLHPGGPAHPPGSA